MRSLAIFLPVFGLAAWTFFVLLLIPVVRLGARQRGEIVDEDFRYGEAAHVPGRVMLPNRNYMNLLELPMLFYLVCLILYVTAGATSLAVAVAWLYVALRVVHSLIHVTYNHVFHRGAAFALSNLALAGLWTMAATHVFGNLR